MRGFDKKKTKKISGVLMQWNKHLFGNVKRETKILRSKLASLFAAPYSSTVEEERHLIQCDLDVLLAKDELYWR